MEAAVLLYSLQFRAIDVSVYAAHRSAQPPIVHAVSKFGRMCSWTAPAPTTDNSSQILDEPPLQVKDEK